MVSKSLTPLHPEREGLFPLSSLNLQYTLTIPLKSIGWSHGIRKKIKIYNRITKKQKTVAKTPISK